MTSTGSKESDTGESRTRTFCRVCEASCGLIATVSAGRITSVEGDRDHLFSRGHFCKKAMGAVEVTYDQDRVTRPLKRTGGPGEFTPISWRQAMKEIAGRLKHIRREHGAEAFATFLGQPPTNSYSTAIWFNAFKHVLRTKWNYAVNAEDAAAYLRANELIYGSSKIVPKPDLWRTDFAIIIGANPFVSHGSLCSEPLMRKCLNGIVQRGGRVVVIDPRRTETAQGFDHVAVNASSDPWLLLAMLREIVSAGLADMAFVRRYAQGYEELQRLVAPFTAARASDHCGVPAGEIETLARAFAASPRGAIYGRTGTCTQRFGTLTNLLQNILCIVTGNVDREGGMVLPLPPLRPGPRVAAAAAPDIDSRVDNLPCVSGMLPSRALIGDILEPGSEKVRALMLLGGNPLSSSGAAGEDYARALEALELHFSLDLYVNETNKYAHYILPVTTMYEHEDMPYKYLFSQLRPALWASPPVVRARGEARDEWRILNEICWRLGEGGAYASPWLRRLARIGLAARPVDLANDMLRAYRPGLSFRTLLGQHPHGLALDPDLPTHILPQDKPSMNIAPAELESEIARLQAYDADTRFPFRLIGMRELLSQNTWMHNAPSLMPPRRRHCLHVHPDDAKRLGLGSGMRARVTSAAGEVEIEVELSDRMKPGNVALPHGWGHSGGWSRANAAGGVNSNTLASNGADEVEVVAGMSILNGIAVRIQPADLSGPEQGR